MWFSVYEAYKFHTLYKEYGDVHYFPIGNESDGHSP